MNINRTFGEYDRKKLCTAIKVLRYSRFSGTTLAKWIYQVAFSRTFTLSDSCVEILENIFLHGDGETEESIMGVGEEARDIAADLIMMTFPTTATKVLHLLHIYIKKPSIKIIFSVSAVIRYIPT